MTAHPTQEDDMKTILDALATDKPALSGIHDDWTS